MMGSGGLVVMGQKTCMVEVARFFMQFIQNESCGKCVFAGKEPSRCWRSWNVSLQGRGTLEDLDLLEELGQAIQQGSLCSLGKSASNPVLFHLGTLPDMNTLFILRSAAPPGVCQALRRYSIDPERCRGCSVCARSCPRRSHSRYDRKPYVIDEDKCLRCGGGCGQLQIPGK